MGALVITATALRRRAPQQRRSQASSRTSRLGSCGPSSSSGCSCPVSRRFSSSHAVRGAGSARTAILIGTGPLISALLAVALLGEPLHAGLVGRHAARRRREESLSPENGRGPRTGRASAHVLAVACAVLFGVRDNVVRWATEDGDPPTAATTAHAARRDAFMLGYVLVRRRAGLGAAAPDRLARVRARRESRSGSPTRPSSSRSTAGA